MAGFEFTALNQPIDAEIMHTQQIGGFLHGIREPFGCGFGAAGVGGSSLVGVVSIRFSPVAGGG
jgi:hypothetical protein